MICIGLKFYRDHPVFLFCAILYEALKYSRQEKDLKKRHLEIIDLKQSNEFMSGITKEDRIRPHR